MRELRLATLPIFLLFNIFGNQEDADSKTIVVNKDALMNYYQYQSRAFNEEVFEEKLGKLRRVKSKPNCTKEPKNWTRNLKL